MKWLLDWTFQLEIKREPLDLINNAIHYANIGNCIDNDPCGKRPCQNGGYCTEYGNDYRCSCPQQYTGKYWALCRTSLSLMSIHFCDLIRKELWDWGEHLQHCQPMWEWCHLPSLGVHFCLPMSLWIHWTHLQLAWVHIPFSPFTLMRCIIHPNCSIWPLSSSVTSLNLNIHFISMTAH